MSLAEKALLLKEDIDNVYNTGYSKGEETGYHEGWYKGEEQGYDRGKNEGRGEGFEEGYREGKQAEYDSFWDVYQKKGADSQSTYGKMFFGEQWTDAIFNPKYDIKFNNGESASQTFYRNAVTNIHQVLAKKGLKIVIGANCKSVYSMFELCDTREIPPIETSHVTNFDYYVTSDGRNVLHTIHEIDMSSATSATRMFHKQGALKNITFKGVIPISLDFQYCPLTVASLKSIVKHLKNYLGTSSEFAYTLTVKASAWQALESEGFTDEDYRHILSVFPDTNPTLVDSWDTFVTAWLRWNLVLAQ